MNYTTISIIIVTYNSSDIIEKCLHNLFYYNDIGLDLEVIIIDNSSADVSSKMFQLLEEKYCGQLKLIKNHKNGGYGQGNNVGIKNASGDILAIMNPDIILTENVFKNALNHFNSHSNLGLLGYKQLGGHNLSFYFKLEHYIPFISSFLTKLLNKNNFFLESYMFLSGAFLFVKKQDFKKIGMFDENIFLYGEESDITHRLLDLKLNLKYDGTKSYLHEIDQRVDMTENNYKIFIESALYYLKKFDYDRSFFLKKLKFELIIKKFIFAILNRNKKIDTINDHIKILDQFNRALVRNNKISL